MPLVERNIVQEALLKDEYWPIISKIQNPTARLNKRKILIKRLSFLTRYAETIGVCFIIYSFYRTTEQQQELYARGLTNADGKNKKSKHQDWHAFDILILGPTNRSRWNVAAGYEALGRFWEFLGGVWGGRWFIDGKTRFNDVYHFQV